MNSAFLNLLTAQLRQYVREPQILFWSFGFPLLLVWLMGVSFSRTDVKERLAGVVLPTENAELRESLRRWAMQLESQEQTLSNIANSESIQHPHWAKVRFKFKFYDNRDDVLRGLKRGEVQLFVEPGVESRSRVYHLDPADSEAMLTYFLLRGGASAFDGNVRGDLEILDSPGLRYVSFVVPGLLALAIMETCLIAVGWTIVEKRITRVARQMRTTPMKKQHFFGAQILACFLFILVELAVLYTFAKVYFDVEAQGGLAPVALLTVAGCTCFSGIAILAASRAIKAQTATGMLEVTMVSLAIFSGVFFSYQNFPSWMLPAIRVLPLTILVDAMRRVFLEGAGIAQIAWQALALSVMGAGSFLLGIRIFRWY